MADDTVTVLLVEDMPEYAQLIQRMLPNPQSFRFNFLHAERLSDGVQVLRENDVDLVVLDLTLPDSRGLKTLSIIMDYAPHLPVIVLTGVDDAVSALKALRQGAQDYLVKEQVDSGILLRSVRYALERKRTENELREILSAYEQLMGGPLTATVRFTGDGQILDCNEVFLKTIRRTEEQCSGLKFWDLLAELPEVPRLREEITRKQYVPNLRFKLAIRGEEPRTVVGSFAVLTNSGEQEIVQATLLDSKQLSRLSNLLS